MIAERLRLAFAVHPVRPLHPQLVGLNVLQVDTSLLDHVLMHPLAVLARAAQPY